MAPPVFGVGLLENTQEPGGRFGWQATQPTVRKQVGRALRLDIGVTSSCLAHSSFPFVEDNCASGHGKADVQLLSDYVSLLGVPVERSIDTSIARRGLKLFQQIRCTSCHVRTHTTFARGGPPELVNVEYHSFSDLRLHDMGTSLAHGVTLRARSWRTSPLWSIGLVAKVNDHAGFLHDGRATSIEEAILWHGGEADASRGAFMSLSKDDRDTLLAYLLSL